MKFIIDMNLSPKWCDFLAALGHDATHWTVVGPFNAPDVDLMKWARQNAAIVISHDLDFGAALAAGGSTGPSVIQIRSDDSMPAAMGDVMQAALRQFEPQLKKGAIVVVEPWRARARILPLRPY